MRPSPVPPHLSLPLDPWVIAGVDVVLKRSARRRTVTLRVSPGTVTLYAPARTPETHLLDFLNSRRGWAEGHLVRYAARQAPATLDLSDGAVVPFLGEGLTVRLDPGVRRARRDGAVLHLPTVNPAAALDAWTRAACRAPYRALVQEYAAQLDAQDRLTDVRVTSARTRWGSCTSGGVIRLHWKLSRAPLAALHYVALHEAAHLLELNHSPRYWRHVIRVMPDWPAQRRWLRDHGHTLP